MQFVLTLVIVYYILTLANLGQTNFKLKITHFWGKNTTNICFLFRSWRCAKRPGRHTTALASYRSHFNEGLQGQRAAARRGRAVEQIHAATRKGGTRPARLRAIRRKGRRSQAARGGVPREKANHQAQS